MEGDFHVDLSHYHALSTDCVLITVDIETTDIATRADIIQIAAKKDVSEFSRFKLPTQRIYPKASEATQFFIVDGPLQHMEKY